MDNSEIQRKLFLEGSIPKAVIKMAIPSVVIQLITLVYNTADTYFISQIDKSAAAAVGAVFAIQAVIQAVGFGIGMGVSSISSRKLGEKADREAFSFASSGLFLVFIMAVIIAVFGNIFLVPLLKLVGCTETMVQFGEPYASVVLSTAPVACTIFVFGNILKAEGNLKFSMYGNVAGALINCVLDPLFIFTFKLGTFGAALATALSQLITLAIYSVLFLKKKTVTRIGFRYISSKIGTYKEIIATGMPTFFRQGLSSFATAFLCRSAMAYGDGAVAAITISNKCYMLVRSIILGIGQGTQPVAGYNYGAGLYKRTRSAYSFTLKVGTVLCLISGAMMYLFASKIMWWFCKDNEVLQYGLPSIRFCSMVIPVMALSTYVNQAYQCLGFKKRATVLASCRQGICFFPMVIILPKIMGITGIELVQPMADLMTFLISIPFYISLYKKLSVDQKVPDDFK